MKNNKPAYLLGLFCIIPLIGAFVGIALILYGIFKYKDRLLVLIGSAGVILTIAAYSFLFYDIEYGKSSAKAFADISQIQLNNLAKQIEFFKLQKGEYPETLEQLRATDVMIVIADPLLTRKMDTKININFKYQRVDKGYVLFSVAIDGIANSPDDIYPTIFDSDSNKFGLIKRKINLDGN